VVGVKTRISKLHGKGGRKTPAGKVAVWQPCRVVDGKTMTLILLSWWTGKKIECERWKFRGV
jgi:hypothetical protein